MINIIARIFKDGQLIGYRLKDDYTNKEQDFTKQQTWLYAKNKQIRNIIASGTEDEPVISGINGFELKKLPEIKWGESLTDVKAPSKVSQGCKFTQQDVNACLIVNILNNGIPYHIDGSVNDKSKYARMCLRDAVIDNKLTEENKNTLSNSILVECPLYDSMNGESNSDIIGYKIKNIGTKDILIYRIRPKDTKPLIDGVLKSGDSKCLSKADLAITAAIPEIGHRFANGKLKMGDTPLSETLYDILNDIEFTLLDYNMPEELKPYFNYSSTESFNNDTKQDIRMLETPYNIDSYFSYTRYKKCIKDGETNRGRLGINDITDSDLLVVNTLRNNSSEVVGYKVKNIGKESITYNIISMVNGEYQIIGTETLHTGESVYLSKVEIGYLALELNPSIKIFNGYISYTGSKPNKSGLGTFTKCYYKEKTHRLNNDDKKINIRDITELDVFSLKYRFGIDTQEKKNIFNMFKR